MKDHSNGYEAAARDYIRTRRTDIGEARIRAWAARLPKGGTVLDLGCGPGVPVTQTLMDAQLNVYAVDASPTMIAAYRARYPAVLTECGAVERSAFFNRSFDGIVAWGLIFLLQPATQAAVIARAARALEPHGRFLFTAPWQTGTWADLLTGRRSVSLGRTTYLQLLADAGLDDVGEGDDEGGNHYYDAGRTTLEPAAHSS